MNAGILYRNGKDYESSKSGGKTQEKKICFDLVKLEKAVRHPMKVLSRQLERNAPRILGRDQVCKAQVKAGRTWM